MEENKKHQPSTDDALQEEQLNKASTDEPIAPAAETIPESEQPSTLNLSTEALAKVDLQPLNPDMEVHHHAHDPAAPHHKKNWKSYFWEFLMLFLAVFCGFLAEYQLEHKIERDREKKYMYSLYQDLKTDTLNLSALIKGTGDDIANNDSLFNIFRSKKHLQETSNAYFFGRRVVTLRPFYTTDGTITQLENSGGLRLIRSRAIVDSIQSYKLAVSFLKNIQGFEREHFVFARSLMGKIFDANVFDIMIGDGSVPFQRLDKNYPLMPFTDAELNDFHIPMNFIKRNKMSQIVLIKGLQKKASDLMKLLEEKYKVHQE